MGDIDMSWLFENLSDYLKMLNSEGTELVFTDEVANLINSIRAQKEEMEKQGFEAEFVLMNKRNYEKLLTYVHHYAKELADSEGLVDKLWGMNVVVWDVPIDYVNVRGKASVEFAYEGAIRRGF